MKEDYKTLPRWWSFPAFFAILFLIFFALMWGSIYLIAWVGEVLQ